MWASLLSGGHATHGGLRTFEPYDASGVKGMAGNFTANSAGILYQGAQDFVQIHKFFRDANLTLVGLKPDDALVGSDPSRWKGIQDGQTFIVYLANPDGNDPGTDSPAQPSPTVEIQLPQGPFSLK